MQFVRFFILAILSTSSAYRAIKSSAGVMGNGIIVNNINASNNINMSDADATPIWREVHSIEPALVIDRGRWYLGVCRIKSNEFLGKEHDITKYYYEQGNLRTRVHEGLYTINVRTGPEKQYSYIYDGAFAKRLKVRCPETIHLSNADAMWVTEPVYNTSQLSNASFNLPDYLGDWRIDTSPSSMTTYAPYQCNYLRVKVSDYESN